MKGLSEKYYSSQDLECIFLLLSMSVTRIQVKNSKNSIYICKYEHQSTGHYQSPFYAVVSAYLHLIIVLFWYISHINGI